MITDSSAPTTIRSVLITSDTGSRSTGVASVTDSLAVMIGSFPGWAAPGGPAPPRTARPARRSTGRRERPPAIWRSSCVVCEPRPAAPRLFGLVLSPSTPILSRLEQVRTGRRSRIGEPIVSGISAESALVGVAPPTRLEPDPHVGHRDAVRANHDRIEIELDKLGQVIGQPGHPVDQIEQRRPVGPRTPSM